MKRVVSIALALILVFTLAVAVAAKDSPGGKKYYSITINTEPSDGSLGTADSDKDSIKVDASGDDGKVTLTADDGDGFFTRWIIDGDYEIVEGDLNSPVLVIIPKSDINVAASFSVDKDYLTMTVSTVGDGTATVNPEKVLKGSGDTVTFEATDGADTFTCWTLECEYDIVSGSLSSRTLVIRPYTDVHGTAYFTNGEEPTEKPSNPDNSKTSPKTGDPLFLVIGLAVLALGAGTLAVKKIKE